MVDLVRRFFQLEAASGIILFFTALLALALANSPWASIYQSFLDIPFQLRIGSLNLDKTLLLWVNDGLMAIFFLLVGMEIKREMIDGSLSNRQQASLPIFAAIGGMIVPAVIYYFAIGNEANLTPGWAIPMATDIAFALGVLSLLSRQVPLSLKVFLLALAIIDDLGAILVIALFYTDQLHAEPLLFAAGLTGLLVIFNRSGVNKLSSYLLIGGFLWIAILKSGIHATIAGVILGFAIPHHGSRSLLTRLEHELHPWISYFILPFFAFANAGLSFDGLSFSSLFDHLPLAIMMGLLIGKPVGVLLISYFAIKLRFATLPHGVTWAHLFGLSLLCGIGFTMSIFISGLAFGIDSQSFELSRLGILAGSFLAAVLGYVFIRLFTQTEPVNKE